MARSMPSAHASATSARTGAASACRSGTAVPSQSKTIASNRRAIGAGRATAHRTARREWLGARLAAISRRTLGLHRSRWLAPLQPRHLVLGLLGGHSTGRYDHNRGPGVMRHMVGNAADHEFGEATMPARAHDDEVGLFGSGRLDDDSGRVALPKQGAEGDAPVSHPLRPRIVQLLVETLAHLLFAHWEVQGTGIELGNVDHRDRHHLRAKGYSKVRCPGQRCLSGRRAVGGDEDPLDGHLAPPIRVASEGARIAATITATPGSLCSARWAARHQRRVVARRLPCVVAAAYGRLPASSWSRDLRRSNSFRISSTAKTGPMNAASTSHHRGSRAAVPNSL